MQWSLNQDINHLIPEFACQILSAKVWLDNLCVKKSLKQVHGFNLLYQFVVDAVLKCVPSKETTIHKEIMLFLRGATDRNGGRKKRQEQRQSLQWKSWSRFLWTSDAIWQHTSGSTLAQIMIWCLTTPSHYLNQCWLIISEIHCQIQSSK